MKSRLNNNNHENLFSRLTMDLKIKISLNIWIYEPFHLEVRQKNLEKIPDYPKPWIS